jgi:hypothetical protein
MNAAQELRAAAADHSTPLSSHTVACWYYIFGFNWFTRRKDLTLGMLFAAELTDDMHDTRTT